MLTAVIAFSVSGSAVSERDTRGVAQQPGQDYRLRHEVTESTGLESRRTENAGVIAPPAGPGTRAQVDVSRSETCRSARNGLRWYRGRFLSHRAKMGDAPGGAGKRRIGEAGRNGPTATRDGSPSACPRYLARVWKAKAHAARRAYERYYERMRNDPVLAIRHVFGVYADQAIRVAKCESGWSMTPRAHNGQYLGTFQMGSSERYLYGHGPTVLEQARAAYRYFVASGRDWSPWGCQP